jgi:hypothetical protein
VEAVLVLDVVLVVDSWDLVDPIPLQEVLWALDEDEEILKADPQEVIVKEADGMTGVHHPSNGMAVFLQAAMTIILETDRTTHHIKTTFSKAVGEHHFMAATDLVALTKAASEAMDVVVVVVLCVGV